MEVYNRLIGEENAYCYIVVSLVCCSTSMCYRFFVLSCYTALQRSCYSSQHAIDAAVLYTCMLLSFLIPSDGDVSNLKMVVKFVEHDSVNNMSSTSAETLLSIETNSYYTALLLPALAGACNMP